MTGAAKVAIGWAELTVWAVVNAVAVLQTVGFVTRIATRSMAINHALGYAIAALAVPALAALVALGRARSGLLALSGPATFLAFVVFMLVVEDLLSIEFRSPARPGILVPYLVLFFGSILLMGLPMFSLDRRLWLVTVATTLCLLGSTAAARIAGVG